MEDKVFPSPAVAGLMRAHLVESRQHTDAQNTLTEEQLAANRRDQAAIAGTKANPYYVLVDPETGNKLTEFKLTGGWTQWEALWLEFLQRELRKAGRTVPAH